MTFTNKLKRKHNFDISILEELLSTYFSKAFSIDNPQYDLEEATESFEELVYYMGGVLDMSSHESRIKEPYKVFTNKYDEMTPKALLVTEESGFEVGLTLFREFNLIWRIPNCDEIKSMNDEFWRVLLEFSSLGKFSYYEDVPDLSSLRKQHQHLFNKRGNFYKLFRNYFLTQVEYGQTRRLGSLSISWNMDTAPELIVKNIFKSVGLLYKLNKMLWKASVKLQKKV